MTTVKFKFVCSLIILSLSLHLAACARKADEKSAFTSWAVNAAQSIPKEDAARASALFITSIKSKSLTNQEIEFLINLSKKTDGHGDQEAMYTLCSETIANARQYPAESKQDVFSFAKKVFAYADANSRKSTEPLFGIALDIFTKLGDTRAIPVLDSFGKTKYESVNSEIETTKLKISKQSVS